MIILSTNAVEYFQLFGMGKIFTVIGKDLPPLKLHFFAHKIAKNRHMKYNIHVYNCTKVRQRWLISKLAIGV